MGARVGEDGVGRGRQERGVDDVLHPGLARGLDERQVLLEPVPGLVRRDHEDDVDPHQRRPAGLPIAIGRDGGVARPRGGAGGVPHEEAGGDALGVEDAGGHPADVAGRAGDSDAGAHAISLNEPVKGTGAGWCGERGESGEVDDVAERVAEGASSSCPRI